MSASGLSLILPAFDEAEHLAVNLQRLVECLERSGRSFEVIVVDDGSRDATRTVAERAAKSDARIRVLAHARNRGKGRALATGAAAARQPVLVLLDADLEIPPADVLPLVERLEGSGAHVAVGSKYHPEARGNWPLARHLLSRLYHLVTAVLFRLPLRDTQTGLKALRREAALSIVPRLRSRRFAWDLELLLLAHRAGLRFVTGPVHVAPAARASRVGWLGALQAGLDTLRIFWRERALAAYASPAATPARPTRVLVSGDDLGLSPAVNEGLVRGLECGGLASVSILATGPAAAAGLRAFQARAGHADPGLHLDLLEGGSLARFAARGLLGGPSARWLAGRLDRQLRDLRERGIEPSHLDAHRHAYFLPGVRRRVCAAAARAGLGAVRSLRPLGPLFRGGFVEGFKRLVLLAAATTSAGAARAHGLVAPAGFVDAREAARWVAAGRVPAYARGRTLEVIAHPAAGREDWPARETGTLDRRGEARVVCEPPLATALRRLGIEVLDFRALARARR